MCLQVYNAQHCILSQIDPNRHFVVNQFIYGIHTDSHRWL